MTGVGVSSESEVLFKAREGSDEPWGQLNEQGEGEGIGLSAHHTEWREVAVGNVVGRVEWQAEDLPRVGNVKDDIFFSVLGLEASAKCDFH